MKHKILSIVLLLLLSSQVKAECVILLHGLAHSSASMQKLESALANEQYKIVNVNYNSRKGKIEKISARAIEPAINKCANENIINFVTHSMGGILVRQYLNDKNIENLGRVVMLAPPNGGSEVVDNMGSLPGFHFIYGDAGLQLGTASTSVPNKLGEAKFDLGIIAGNRSHNHIFSWQIPGADDGKVSIESTKLKGMNKHIVMPVSHSFIMKNKMVITQVINYLKHGDFLARH